MNIKNYDHIIWDWNGTLLDDVWLCIEIINQMLLDRNMDQLTPEQYRTIFDFPVKGYYQRAGFSFDAEPFEELATQFCSTYDVRVNECQLFSQVPTLLGSIKNSGISQSILSATEQSMLNQMAESFGVEHYFSAAIGQTDNSATGKIETGQTLIRNLSIDPKRVLLIGDTVHDLDVANEIGVDCLLVAHGHHAKGKLSERHHSVADSFETLFS